MKKILLFFMATMVVLSVKTSEFKIKVHSLQSKRPTQEDRFQWQEFEYLKKPGLIAAVFDGHRGVRVADYARTLFCSYFCEQLKEQSSSTDKQESTVMRHVLNKTFEHCNEKFRKKAKKYNWKDGSTGVTAVIYDGWCHFGNLGDSRGYLRCGDTFHVTTDHKPNDPEEAQYYDKIEKKLPVLIIYGTSLRKKRLSNNLIDNHLNITRAFGDYDFKDTLTMQESFEQMSEENKIEWKQYCDDCYKNNYPKDQACGEVENVAEYYPLIRENPDITSYELQGKGEYVILASDGFWDVVKNEEVDDLVNKIVQPFWGYQFLETPDVAQQLVEEAVNVRKSDDNTTVLFIALPESSTKFRRHHTLLQLITTGAVCCVISYAIIKYLYTLSFHS